MKIPKAKLPYSRQDGQVFLILLSLYCIILLPIVRANRYYNDDLNRALIGRQGWDATGRPLTNLLMRALQCYDHAMVDISPFTQFAGIALLAWAGVLIARRFAIQSPWLAALAAFPLGGQPFYLENLSYKFDALSMSLALLLALLPIIGIANSRRGWWLGIISLFASLNFYQAAINAYLIFILLEAVLAQVHDLPPREWIGQLKSRVLQAATAMIIYEVVVGVHINGWVKRKSETIHNIQQLSQIETNFFDFWGYVSSSFNEHWWMYFTPTLIVLALFPVAIGLRYAAKWGPAQPIWTRGFLLLSSVLLPVAALLCVLGPMLVLSDPPIVPRVLPGVGALLAAALIVMQASLGRWQRSDKWALSISAALGLGMCVFANAYGNAMTEQKSYEERIAARLADDIAEANAHQPIHVILLMGTAGYSPVAAHVVGQLPLVRSLVPIYLDAEDNFRTHMFLRYFLPDLTDLRLSSDPISRQRASVLRNQIRSMPPTVTRAAYSFYVRDEVAIVMLHPPVAIPGEAADAPATSR